jgi:hypothetical protein
MESFLMTRRSKLRLILADDHPVLREGLSLMLGALPDMAVVVGASTGEEAFELFLKLEPDVLILGLQMPGKGGLSTLKRLLKKRPGALAPDNPDYKGNYQGDLRSRDSAYDQGTVRPWLVGPFIDAWVKVCPEDGRGARRFLQSLVVTHQLEACVGSISEIFDAEAPFTPGGCVRQARSVAEVLRSWVITSSAYLEN